MMTSRFLSWLIAASLVLAPVGLSAQITPESTGLTQAAGPSGLQSACGADVQVCLAQIIGRVIQIALGFVEVLLFIYLLYGGFLWMTSGGEEGGVKKAKMMIKNAVIGLVIIALSFVLTSYVVTQLSGAIGTKPPTP